MQLNGWMRLWIVFSVSWLILIGSLAYEDLSTLYKERKYEISKEGIGTAIFIFSDKQSKYDVEEYFEKNRRPLLVDNPQNYVGKIDDSPYKEYIEENVTKAIVEYIKLALIPILGLLVLGWSIAWIIRGFKMKSKTIL